MEQDTAGMLTAAQAWATAGCSVVPARTDGTKAPAAFWKQYQTQPATAEQVTAWMTSGAYHGFGVIPGAVSGQLEMYELEGRAMAEGYLDRYVQALKDHGYGELWNRIIAGYSELTPSGGLHLFYRVDGAARANTKLACRPSTPDELAAWKVKQQAGVDAEEDPAKQARRQHTLDGVTRGEQVPQVLIETRGEGGFVVVAPSAGRTHESGKAWTLLRGGPASIADITEDERGALYAIASLLDEMPVIERLPASGKTTGQSLGQADDGIRPGDDYNLKADWDDILGPHGWTHVQNYGRARGWRRPGKNRGVSATTGSNDGDNLYVFSTATEFQAETPYSKFAAYTLLEHGGDYARAAKELRRQGYGGERLHGDENLHELIADYTPPPASQGNLALAPVHQLRPNAAPANGKHRIDLTHEDTAALAIAEAITERVIPDLYVRSGEVSQVGEIDDGTGPRLIIAPVGADSLRMLLAQHTACYRIKKVKEEFTEASGLPAVATARAVLSQTDWPGLPVLAGVTAMPMIRRDGSVLTAAGYDTATRLYHRPAFPVAAVPDEPSREEVEQALAFVLDHVLADFCWDSKASKANYLGLLMTPILRLRVGGLPPLGIISATTRGSGKTLLIDILGALYGLKIGPWVKSDEEMAKEITSTLRDTTEPVVTFDNVDSFDTVNHPSLAGLLTMTTWDKRILGSTANFRGINDRLWCVTGNNVAIGGDIASRSLLVRLDPHTERPEERDGFVIEDLWSWLKDDDNRGRLLHALLVLARSWIAAGAPRDETIHMRNFSAWAQSMGGLTAFHGVTGFLTNREELTTGSDDEETSTVAFITKWHEKFGSSPKQAKDLIESAQGDNLYGSWIDPWDGTFPSRGDGKQFSVKGMGRFLSARRGRIFGGLVLDGGIDQHSKVWSYRVSPVVEPTEGEA